MIPTRLKLLNFTSYTNPPELDFTKFKLAAISGANGAGKSSLLDAITWCLWGSSRAGDSSDPLVHSGETSMEVQFIFDLDGNEYTVKRLRSKKGGGSTSLELWGDTHNLTEGTIKTTQEKIISLLHLSFETFTNSAFLRQAHADEFTTKGPTDRKRILADILGLDHYDVLEERAKEKVKEAQNKLQLLEYQLLEIEAELSQKEDSQSKKKEAEEKVSLIEKKIFSLESELKSLQEERASFSALGEQRSKAEQSLISAKEELKNIISQGKKRAEDIKALEENLKLLPEFEVKLIKLKDTQKKLDELDSKKQRKLELEKEISVLRGELNLKNSQETILKDKLKELEEKLAALKIVGAKCPTCGQEIGRDEKHKVLESLKGEALETEKKLSLIDTKKEEDAIENLNKDLGSLKLDDREYRSLTEDLKALEEIERKREELIRMEATLESEKKTITEARALFITKKAQVEKLEKEINILPEPSVNLAKIESQILPKENELIQLRSQEKDLRNLLGQVTELISRQKQLENLLEEKSKEKKSLTKEKEIFEELSLAFGKKGIQAMIIENAIPEIEDETNTLLEKLTDGRMQIGLETQRETKTKVETMEGTKEYGTIETLDIIISDEMGERPYEMYSGGEAFRVNFAIRLAISKLLTHRAGARLQFLVIDEGFGTQDAEGRTRLVEVIDAIKDDFEKILIITHLEELKEEFPTRIEVTKDAGGSNFKVVGG